MCGKDLSEDLPLYRLDKKTMGRIRVNVVGDIETARKELGETDDIDQIKKISKWISKRLIRDAGTMCMWREDFYTMEVLKLAKMFASHYPEQKEGIETLLSYTENPPTSLK